MSIELRHEARMRELEHERLRRERQQLGLDLRSLAELPEGVRFFSWLLRREDIFRDDYLPGTAGAYRAGRKAGAVELWRLLRLHLPREKFMDLLLGDGDQAGRAAGPVEEPGLENHSGEYDA